MAARARADGAVSFEELVKARETLLAQEKQAVEKAADPTIEETSLLSLFGMWVALTVMILIRLTAEVFAALVLVSVAIRGIYRAMERDRVASRRRKRR